MFLWGHGIVTGMRFLGSDQALPVLLTLLSFLPLGALFLLRGRTKPAPAGSRSASRAAADAVP